MKSKSMVFRPPPKSDEVDFNIKLYDSPHPDRSDDSFVDSYDLSDITPVRNAVWVYETKSKTVEIRPFASSTLWPRIGTILFGFNKRTGRQNNR